MISTKMEVNKGRDLNKTRLRMRPGSRQPQREPPAQKRRSSKGNDLDKSGQGVRRKMVRKGHTRGKEGGKK